MRTLSGFLVACAFAASGCQTNSDSAKFPKFDNLTKAVAKENSTLEEKHAAAGNDFEEAIVFCRSVLNYYERKAKHSTNYKLWIGTAGAIAGGVIAPSLAAGNAAKSAIGAWSGISGVTNSLITELGNGSLSEEFFLLERRAVAKTLRDKIQYIAEQSDPQKKADMSRVLAATCVASEVAQASPEGENEAPPKANSNSLNDL